MDTPDQHAFGDIVARIDQVKAEFRGVADLATTYLEFLENENVPEPLRSELVRDWHREFWRAALADVGPSAARLDT